MNWSLAGTDLVALVVGYLLGSIPFGLLTRIAGLGDIRAIGSGNIGATNVLRTGRKDLAAATLAARRAQRHGRGAHRAALFGRDAAIVAGLGAFLGHLFPVWLRFKGGKGVATFLGVLSASVWPAAARLRASSGSRRRSDPLFVAGGADREPRHAAGPLVDRRQRGGGRSSSSSPSCSG